MTGAMLIKLISDNYLEDSEIDIYGNSLEFTILDEHFNPSIPDKEDPEIKYFNHHIDKCIDIYSEEITEKEYWLEE